MNKTIEGAIGQITGIPVFENKNMPEGTYQCLDKDGLPIPHKDTGKVAISKIIVHDFVTFKIAMEHNQEKPTTT